ncbi:Holliday junction resolvase RuvX [Natronosporangium hydrolyticum]|uniref:Putative pre-16S rRNA nuclease n=1 Tax=Natronosporangium hydrolyticum TaxID=2811111 RepID=A0A895YGK3_9ACTN|nr:Holliday junction resolvase RuvX [Natronosporangium hydrolyticum]QSB16947.1 Holliday junction resolvase RuvX [Natronosporangium hydrolyticum]
MTEFTPGRRLGVDVGDVRIGVAICDPSGLVATPLTTVMRDRDAAEDAIPADMSELGRLVAEHGTVEIVVGLPVTLAGSEGPAAAQVRRYAQRLAQLLDPVPVTLADERMSTMVATRRLSERGIRGRRRRQVIDQAAAAEILQGWLDAQRRRASG